MQNEESNSSCELGYQRLVSLIDGLAPSDLEPSAQPGVRCTRIDRKVRGTGHRVGYRGTCLESAFHPLKPNEKARCITQITLR